VSVQGKPGSRTTLSTALKLTRVLGTLSLLIGAGQFAWVGISSTEIWEVIYWLIIIYVLALYIVPGLILIGFSFPLERRKRWAIIVSIVVATLQLAFTLFTVVHLWFARDSVVGFLVFVACPLGVALLAILSIIYLAKSLYFQGTSQRRQAGFAPVFPIQPPSP
jgi:hypothetical protein